MKTVFEIAKQKYIQLKGDSNYTSLYSKINRSSALTELCGASVRRGLAPTVADFTYKATMMPSIYFTFDSAKSSMAALIMLKIWNEQVNEVYHLCSPQVLRSMALHIVAESIYLR